ncbi:hypothetical protein ES708_21458 [subsurface metagenome]
MKIDEAIKENQETLCVPNSEFLKPKYQAIALGTEALKQIKQVRAYAKELYLPLLPGETEE